MQSAAFAHLFPKNTSAFTRVGGVGEAKYGLKDWYPAAKEPKKKSTEAVTPADSDLSDAQVNNHENSAADPSPQGPENPKSDYSDTASHASENAVNAERVTPPGLPGAPDPVNYDRLQKIHGHNT